MNIPKWNGWFILCMFAKIIPGILLRRGGFLAAIIFSTEKRWGQISWPVGPAAHTAHSEHPRSPTACSARCPQFWLDVVHIAGLQRPRANCFIHRWDTYGRDKGLRTGIQAVQGTTPGGIEHADLAKRSAWAARGGWHQPQSQEPAANLPSFLCRKDNRNPHTGENDTAPSQAGKRRCALCFQEAISSRSSSMTTSHCVFSSISQSYLFRNRRAASPRT